MAMDSMIYYTDDDLGQALAGLARGCRRRRLHRRTAHAVPDGVLHGRQAVPAVRPFTHDDPPFAASGSPRKRLCTAEQALFPRWSASRGFYISTCLEYRA
jgi:hypothetical protein